MHEVLVQFPVRVLVEQATVDPNTEKVSVHGVMSVEAEGKIAVAVFTDHDLAVRYARENGFPNAQVGVFEDPIDFGYFLQVQKSDGFTHICIDPQYIGGVSPMFPIDEALKTLAASLGRTKP